MFSSCFEKTQLLGGLWSFSTFKRNLEMKKILIFMMLSFFGSSVYAGTFSYRNAKVYNLWQNTPAVHIIYTHPIQPKQPVFAWRTHTNFNGKPGIHTQKGVLIGYTNNQGVLSIVVPKLPQDSKHCGWIRNERVAVGSLNSPKSNSLNFTIIKSTEGIPRPFPPHDPLCVDPSGSFIFDNR